MTNNKGSRLRQTSRYMIFVVRQIDRIHYCLFDCFSFVSILVFFLSFFFCCPPIFYVLYNMYSWLRACSGQSCEIKSTLLCHMKWQIIAEDRGICLKSGPLWSTISHYTIDFSWLCFCVIRRNLSEFLNMFKMLRQAEIPSDCNNRDRQNCRGYHTSTRCHYNIGVVGGPSQFVVS